MISAKVLCQVTEYIRKFSVVFLSAGSLVFVSVMNGKTDVVKYK